jgi:RecB family exonuclease
MERYQSKGTVDLDRVLVVVPGGRAGRRFEELFLERVDQLGLAYFPPQVITAGQLPELLYEPRRRFASPLVQQLAWARALSESDRTLVAQVISRLPASANDPGWLALGRILRRQHSELAAEGCNFSDVARSGEPIDGFGESPRWQILSSVQRRYFDILDELQLWDRQTARLVAIERNECRFDGDIILLGTVDINRTLRRMLDQVADKVTALVHAPREWSDRFDQYGCLDPRAWQQLPMDLGDDQVHVVDGPAEQVEEVIRILAGYEGRYRADQITIGVPDERIVPYLLGQLAEFDAPGRWGPGAPATQSAPYRFFEALAAYLRFGGWRELSALARHPDMEPWIEKQGIDPAWLTELDDYYVRHLPWRLVGDWPGPAGQHARVRQVSQALTELVGRLVAEPQEADQWYEPLVRVLSEVYRDQPASGSETSQRTRFQALEELHRALGNLTQIPARLTPRMTAAEAIDLALGELESTRIAAPANPAAIELLGWLELPLDDAPALIVTSVQEGLVPQSVNADLFLPNTLRSRLGLDDNARRYARDAYALRVLLASREELDLIVARRNVEGEPQVPSRLLLAADGQTIAARALRFFQPPARRVLPHRPLGVPFADGQGAGLEIPRPLPLTQPIDRLSATAFRSYLACPYRFYLEHVLKLESVDDKADEMDPASFGSLLHEVLRRLATSTACQSADDELIFAALGQALDTCAAETFGEYPLPAVRVQIEQLRLRLKAFAVRQAQWFAKGWRIGYTEAPEGQWCAVLEVDRQPFTLSGRIDRIDVHETTGEHVILDYKSSDAGDDPDKVHRRGGRWVDLQLPLYRHLARAMGIDAPMRMGYVLLPKDLDEVRFALAEWSQEELDEADAAAREVVRAIRRQEFWPPADDPRGLMSQFAAICQEGVFRAARGSVVRGLWSVGTSEE